MKNRTPRRATGGFSLVELMIVATVFLVLVGAVTLTADANARAYQTGMTVATLESQSAIAVERVAAELRTAGLATLNPDPAPGVGSDNLRYAKAVDYQSGAIVWTPKRFLRFEYEQGELDDGVDNNGNGLVDEGRLVITEDAGGPNERQWVLTHGVAEYLEGELDDGVDNNGNGLVDERGFCIERLDLPDAEAIRVRLTLVRRDAEGRVMTRTATTSVQVRN
jgi:hypothetical protein